MIKKKLKADRILVRGVNWLGDAVMTTPAMRRLREAFPLAQITVLTHEKLAELWETHECVNAVITFNRRDSLLDVVRRLRPHSFQLGLAFPDSFRSALELWLARIPQRVGYACRGRSLLLTRRVPARPGAVRMRKKGVKEAEALALGKRRARPLPLDGDVHQMHDYLHLVAAVGGNPAPLAPLLTVTQDQLEDTSREFGLTPGRRWFALNAGAEYGPAKRWPAERFVQAAVQIQQRTGCRWIVIGARGDEAVADAVASGIHRDVPEADSPLNLAGDTSLPELGALLKQCSVLLTNDTGPMHVAAAVGTPVVVPFGSTSLELTGPGLPGDPRHRLLSAHAPCAPCFLRDCPIDHRCMHDLPVERVVQSVLEVVGGPPAPAGLTAL